MLLVLMLPLAETSIAGGAEQPAGDTNQESSKFPSGGAIPRATRTMTKLAIVSIRGDQIRRHCNARSAADKPEANGGCICVGRTVHRIPTVLVDLLLSTIGTSEIRKFALVRQGFATRPNRPSRATARCSPRPSLSINYGKPIALQRIRSPMSGSFPPTARIHAALHCRTPSGRAS